MADLTDRRRIALVFDTSETERLCTVQALRKFSNALLDAGADPDLPVQTLRDDQMYGPKGLLVEWDVDG